MFLITGNYLLWGNAFLSLRWRVYDLNGAAHVTPTSSVFPFWTPVADCLIISQCVYMCALYVVKLHFVVKLSSKKK